MVEVQGRTILWHFSFIGFAINYLVSINLNIAIVEMIAPPSLVLDKNVSEVQLFSSTENATVNLTNQYLNQTTAMKLVERKNISINNNTVDSSGKSNDLNLNINSTLTSARDSMENTDNELPKSNQFHWNEEEQALVLGAIFWATCITQLPGGILARKYGTKLIFGLSNVISCWLCFFIPMAAKTNLYLLVFLRILQGLLTGASWPAMHHMAAKWIPPNERSKFVTAYYGSSVGVAVFYPLYAYVMHFSSWELTFHISGIIGTIWWFGWLYFVYDTPAQHPRISTAELDYIEKSLKSMVQTSDVNRTPWKAILTDMSVWMNVIGHFGAGWGLFTLLTQTPTYFKILHNWDIRATGIFSGLPHLMRVIFAFIFSLYADFLLRTEKMNRTNVRKLATGLSLGINAVFVLALAYFGTDPILAITFITLATMIQGAGSSGPLSSMIDIAPNYAGVILGICGTIGCIPGFLSAYIVGVFTLNNQNFEAWKIVFLICAAVLMGSGLLYVCFADSTLKPWNDYSLNKDDDKEKRQQLMAKNIDNCESTLS